jgi:hypothetical protein
VPRRGRQAHCRILKAFNAPNTTSRPHRSSGVGPSLRWASSVGTRPPARARAVSRLTGTPAHAHGPASPSELRRAPADAARRTRRRTTRLDQVDGRPGVLIKDWPTFHSCRLWRPGRFIRRSGSRRSGDGVYRASYAEWQVKVQPARLSAAPANWPARESARAATRRCASGLDGRARPRPAPHLPPCSTARSPPTQQTSRSGCRAPAERHRGDRVRAASRRPFRSMNGRGTSARHVAAHHT